MAQLPLMMNRKTMVIGIIALLIGLAEPAAAPPDKDDAAADGLRDAGRDDDAVRAVGRHAQGARTLRAVPGRPRADYRAAVKLTSSCFCLAPR